MQRRVPKRFRRYTTTHPPQKGDVIHVQESPDTVGHELKGHRYGVVISHAYFNRHGIAFVCSISRGQAEPFFSAGTLVSLWGSQFDGYIQVHQLRSIDWKARNVEEVGRLPSQILDDVDAVLERLLFDQ